MPKVRVEYEAVRYLIALAAYNNDDTAKRIVDIVKYGRRSKTFDSLISNPYRRDDDTNRALKVFCEVLSKLHDKWYVLIKDESGRSKLLQMLYGVVENDIVVEDDKNLLDFYKSREVMFIFN